MPNEFNEGEFYASYDFPVSNEVEKQVVSALFNRLEERKVSIVQGIDMSKPSGPKVSTVGSEFPRALYNLQGAMKVVKNKEEMDAAKLKGFFTSRERGKVNREKAISLSIREKEVEIAALMVEYEKITGKSFELTPETDMVPKEK